MNLYLPEALKMFSYSYKADFILQNVNEALDSPLFSYIIMLLYSFQRLE